MKQFKVENNIEVKGHITEEAASKERARKVIGSLILGIIRDVNTDMRKANENVCNSK